MSEHRALILTYHAISEGPAPLCQAPARLEDQLDLLGRAGFRAVSLTRLVDALVHASELPADCFALTFDDGYRNFADAALPILSRRNIPSTLFATASPNRAALPGGTGASLLALEELAGLREQGVEIGAHSVGHCDLTRLDDESLARELRECRQVLEAHSGGLVEHFAYPFGRFDARVRRAVAREYRSACTTELARVRRDADPLAIPRVDAYYLRSPMLRMLLQRGRPDAYLALRRRLRRLRGSEPRTEVALAARAATPTLTRLEQQPCR